MKQPTPAQPTVTQIVNHSVHGLATIRLIDPPDRLARSLVHDLGVSAGNSAVEPDISVRFIERFPDAGRLRMLELNNEPFAFDDDNFYLMDDQGHRTLFNFDLSGSTIELVCEQGVSKIPLLSSLLGIALLRKGHLMLHSAAFAYRGKGILVTGWQTGGKSEMLLAYMNAGARYISDDWTIIRGTDSALCGLTAHVNTWAWQLEQLPALRARLSSAERFRLGLIRVYRRLYSALPLRNAGHGSLPLRLLARIDAEGARTARTSSSPQRLFGKHVQREPISLDRLFLASVAQDGIAVLPVDPHEIAQRMSASQLYERRDLHEAYTKYRFAFPDRTDDALSGSLARELLLLKETLDSRQAYEILHPYPVLLHHLYQATEAYCR